LGPLTDPFLPEVPLEEALSRWFAHLRARGLLAPTPVAVPVAESLGRWPAELVLARRSCPHYCAAAMDGYAVRSADTAGAAESRPRRLKVGVEAVAVSTGQPVPDGFDAVVMLEEVERTDDGHILLRRSVPPWQHVRMVGEDLVSGEAVLHPGRPIGPVEQAMMLAAGVTAVKVWAPPPVAVIPTGSELVPADSDPGPGEIPEFNSIMLANVIRQWGGEPSVYDPVPDDPGAIASCLLEAARGHRVLVINAGSSRGPEDHVGEVCRRLGEVVVHGVALRPGKPTLLGSLKGCALLGLPGYPVSAYLTARLFLRPLLEEMLGRPRGRDQVLRAVCARTVVSPPGRDEFLRVILGRVDERWVAVPLPRGAGVLSSLARADGLVWVPRGSEGVSEGTEVEVTLIRSPEEVRDVLLIIGSHDLSFDVLAAEVAHRRLPWRLSAMAVGSLGGLAALRRGWALVAGIHLLDEETGSYNLPFVRRMLDEPAVLVALAHRWQGLMVKAGNPKGLADWTDLAREDVVFINRQRGSGTRLLLDYHLRRRGIDPGRLPGYDHEVGNHLAVAQAVAAGRADVGLGVEAAAREFGLEFIPLARELFELVIPRRAMDDPRVTALLDIVASGDFRRALEALPGYDCEVTGRVRAVGEGEGR